MLKKYGVKMWNDFNWLRMRGCKGGLFWTL